MRKLSTVLLLAFCVGAFSQEMKFGLRVGQERLQEASALAERYRQDPSNPLALTVVLPEGWEGGDFKTSLPPLLGNASRAGYLVNLAVPVPAAAGEERLTALVSLSESVKEVVSSFELSFPETLFTEEEKQFPDKLAYSVKRLSLSLRGGSKARVYLGPVTSGYASLLEPLYQEEIIAYVDGYFTYDVDSSGTPPTDVSDLVQEKHLGAPLRLHLRKVRTSLGAQTNTMLALSRGAAETDIEIEALEEGFRDLSYLRTILPRTMAAGYEVTGVAAREGEATRFDIAIMPFIDSETMAQGFYLAPSAAASSPGVVNLHMLTADITDPRGFPMPSGPENKLGFTADQKKGQADVKVAWEGKPQFVLVDRLKTGTVSTADRMEVTGTYKIPVEFIIARHQAAEQSRNVLLKNYTADAQVDYHFKVPGTMGSVDVTFRNQFLFDTKEGARWVQKELLVNGVRWRGKTIPELPIVEPEKINTLPLVLTMTRAYSYRLLREEDLEGSRCWVVEFLPAAGEKVQDVSGKVWIDRETYLKRQVQIVQKNMAPPQVSNEEFDQYQVFRDDGQGFNLLSEIRAQQIFTVIGQTVTGEKEVRFSNVVVNDGDFAMKLNSAIESDAPILQDTEKGYRYLTKNEDGSRSIQWEERTGRPAAVGGAYYDKSLDFPIPFAGVNYFDYDFKKTGTQVNMFLAGPVNSFSVSKANVLPKLDLAASGVFFLFGFKDRYYENGVELEDQELKTMSQRLYTSAGYRPTEFSKIKLTLNGQYVKIKDTGETAEGFETPSSHFDLGYGLAFDYSRKGWQAAASWEGHRRSSWEDWGYGLGDEEITKNKDYILWDVSLGKTFYLPNFQKVGASVSYMDGKDLDRFSKYEFKYMGSKSLSGFTGSGIRFDKGAIGKLMYAFDVAKVIRFSANLDHARVKQDRDDADWQSHTGFGFSGTVAGPWSTLWSLDLGYAIDSDVPEAKHEATAALIVLWLWGK